MLMPSRSAMRLPRSTRWSGRSPHRCVGSRWCSALRRKASPTMLRQAPAPCSAVSSRRSIRTHASSTSPHRTIWRRWKKVCVLDLAGKVAIVTGASRGIGRSIAATLAAQGAYVIAGARGTNANDTVAEIQAAGHKADVVALEVTDAASIGAVVSGVLERHGRIDILVNNAGIARDQLMLRMKRD